MNRTSGSRRRRSHSTPAQRAQWVREYEQSGLSQKDFARRHELGLSTLQKWIAQARSVGSKAGTEPLWQEVKLPVGANPPHWAMELVRRDGVIVRVAHDAPAVWVEQLLRAC